MLAEVKHVKEKYKKVVEKAQQYCQEHDQEYAAQCKKVKDQFAEATKGLGQLNLKYKQKS